MSSKQIEPLTFHNSAYTELESLVNDMGKYWNEGKQLLFEGKLREHTRKQHPSFANSCAAAEKELGSYPKESNRIYLKWLCKFDGIKGLYWKGSCYGNFKSIANFLCSSSNDELNDLLLFMMDHQYLSMLAKSLHIKDSMRERIRFIERNLSKSDTMFEKENALPILSVILSESKDFYFQGKRFTTPKDLAAYLQGYADKSKEELSRAVKPLFQDEYNLDPYFEAWIIMHGYQHELALWKARFQEGQGVNNDIHIDFSDDDEDLDQIQPDELPENNKELTEFERLFKELLTNHSDRIDDEKSFRGLLNDYFPMYQMEKRLIYDLYRMDIVKAIRESTGTDDLLMVRFEKRLVKDFGVKDDLAKWAVGVWFRCYS